MTSGRPYVMHAALGLRRPRVAVRGRDLAGRIETVGAAVPGPPWGRRLRRDHHR